MDILLDLLKDRSIKSSNTSQHFEVNLWGIVITKELKELK
jgi:hypothetical protein